jgi:diphthamide synthase subunit DPH2
MTTEIQTQVERLVPQIRDLSLRSLELQAEIASKEMELSRVPVVVKLTQEINELKEALEEIKDNEDRMRYIAKNRLMESGIKEIKTLQGETVALHITPGQLVIEDGAVIPEEYYKVKKEVDKTKIKKAYNDGIVFDEKIYIQKDYKLVII